MSQQAGTISSAPSYPSLPLPATVTYRCGDCGAENKLQLKDAVRCRQCGFRVLYKTRTKRMVQFEAR